MRAELCLAHDMGGGGIGGPLSVDMRPYGCFIIRIAIGKVLHPQANTLVLLISFIFGDHSLKKYCYLYSRRDQLWVKIMKVQSVRENFGGDVQSR